MTASHPRERKTNLELYLNDVYEKECLFKIEKEEVDFIQTGIEKLVQDLVDQILEADSFQKYISKVLSETLLKKGMYDSKSLAEVYFPIKDDCALKDYVSENAGVKTAKFTTVKVGSFYEETKNHFPNEFDCIFLLLGVRNFHTQQYFPLLCIIENICQHVKDLNYISLSIKHLVRRKLEFDKHVCIHGPASKLRFIYSNGFGKQRRIHVDLVPADRIVDSKNLEWFIKEVRKHVKPKAFCEAILTADSNFIVGTKLAFTETEQHFMKNTLSKKHVKVYRILKYIINGHGDAETLELCTFEPYYTSYRIKVKIIFHHEICKDNDTENLGPCVLRILEEMGKLKTTNQFPTFTCVDKPLMPFRILPFLKSTLKSLRSMQTLDDDYFYEPDRKKSVTFQFWDYLTCEDTSPGIGIRELNELCCTLL